MLLHNFGECHLIQTDSYVIFVCTMNSHISISCAFACDDASRSLMWRESAFPVARAMPGAKCSRYMHQAGSASDWVRDASHIYFVLLDQPKMFVK